MPNDATAASRSDVLSPGLDLVEPGRAQTNEAAQTARYALKRIICFFSLVSLLAFGLNTFITTGLRGITTSEFGVSNRMMQGQINAQVVITGSSRALSHYDPRIIQQVTGLSAFNLGRNGSQTDMQLAVLKTYLEHNRKPDVVIHNLDAFSFVTTREVYNPAQYIPYLYDEEIYKPLRRINPDIWKSRYVPLYGYAVEDMQFSWMKGVGAHLGWSPREDFFLGFNPRPKPWTNEFQSFKVANPKGVSWDIEPAGVQLVEELIQLCQQKGIRLIFVYSPEYSEMQKLTKNRETVFAHFREFSARYNVPFWDYSAWKYSGDTEYFTNSQHLNARGATVFSGDVASQLKGYLGVQSLASADAKH